ncbi:MAG: MBL fold metallo-hydrolase [Candidatus Omnitrophota bacterium]|nr:MAG: MBL fold metallo-hydrolase [Candidatus Omnitrophota bacterium]
MKITWMGHSCFLLETEKGTKILTDPYEPKSYAGAVGYGPLEVEPDIITVSHKHADHNYTQPFLKAEIVDRAGKFTIADAELEGIPTFHDDQQGAERGKNIIFIIRVDDLCVAHFGDLGTLDIDPSQLSTLDIALVPVGGTFTIGANEATELTQKLNPQIVVPMHFKTPKLGFGIDWVEKFLKDKDYEKRESLEVNLQNIHSFKRVVVLQYQR